MKTLMSKDINLELNGNRENLMQVVNHLVNTYVTDKGRVSERLGHRRNRCCGMLSEILNTNSCRNIPKIQTNFCKDV